MHEAQYVVHLLAVHGSGIGVARRDAEQVRVAPLAGATPPRVEVGGGEVQDARAGVASTSVVRALRVLRAGGDETAAAAVVTHRRAGSALRLAHDREPLVEPLGDRGPLVGGPDDLFAHQPVHEVGPHDAQRRPRSTGQAQDRDPHRGSSSGSCERDPPAPEVELPELGRLRSVTTGRSTQPPTRSRARRHGGVVDAGVLPPRGPVAEHLGVPVRGLREDGLLLGLEIGAQAVEVGGDRRPQFGVGSRAAARKARASAAAVDGVVRPITALELPRPGGVRTSSRPAGAGTASPSGALRSATTHHGKPRSPQACVPRLAGLPTREHPLRIAIGSDHAGFRLKEHFIAVLREGGHDVDDLGTDSEEPVDYPIYCSAVGREVAAGPGRTRHRARRQRPG